MAGDGNRLGPPADKEIESAEGKELLQEQGDDDAAFPDGDVTHHANGNEDSQAVRSGGKRQRGLPRRQSSFAQHRPHGTPRTQNRVRFDVAEPPSSMDQEHGNINDPQSPTWLDEEDYGGTEDGRRHAQTAPLLTSLEAPSVTLANEIDIDPADYLESARPKSGLQSAFMNMANSIIGAGIIGQPYAFKQAGLFTGLVLLVSLTITVDWTIRLIVTNSKLSGADSFQATMQKCFGKAGLVAISVAQWAFAFGGMVAFCVIIGDTIPRVVASAFPSLYDRPVLWLLTDRRAIIVVFVLGVSYPLSLYRDIAMLAKASTLALVSMLIILITIITQGPLQSLNLRGPLRGSLLINSGVFQAIGVISFAFVCHHNSLLIYGSLKTPTMDRFAKVTHYSTGISMLACMMMALGGYLSFGDLTQGNVLNNFPTNNVMVNIARLCFGLNMLTTLPLECFVCREVMNEYFFPGAPFNTRRHLIYTTGLIVSAMSVSLVTCDLGIVFELVGATSACALAYILPPLCFIRLTKRRTWETYAAYACIAFGCIVMAISLTLSVLKLLRGDGEGATCR